MAQQSPDGAASPAGRQETVPLRVKDEQVANLQQKLNGQGFSAGQVDGLWGPNTSAALKRYQAKNGLQQTGQLDSRTLAALGTIDAAPASPVTPAATPLAQTGPTPPPPAPVVAPPPGALTPATPSAGTLPSAGVADRNTGSAGSAGAAGNTGAAGNQNQAVATTAANAVQPAKGANSFTAAQAQQRIESEGYAAVTDLTKDGDGIWRGHGTKGGTSVGVWLDYKGNVGQQ